MTNEEKQLLIKDLSTRLPYGVKCHLLSAREPKEPKTIVGLIPSFELFLLDKKTIFGPTEEGYNICMIKPYLRSMSSMTEEEYKEYSKAMDADALDSAIALKQKTEGKRYISSWYRGTDWLLEHHFDYQDLIEKGLALEAPEGMYIK